MWKYLLIARLLMSVSEIDYGEAILGELKKLTTIFDNFSQGDPPETPAQPVANAPTLGTPASKPPATQDPLAESPVAPVKIEAEAPVRILNKPLPWVKKK